VVLVGVVYVVFWPLSDLIARHDVGAITGRGYGAALQTARDAARGRLVALGAGLFAAGALVYTGRNFALSRQGQVTDRYTKAIEQLGSDKLDVRVGGIYALERIARDSPWDHPTIMEVLAVFIRDRSREQWAPAVSAVEPTERTPRPDIQAALTVIGRRNPRHDHQTIDLHGAILGGADLHGANLTGARLLYTNLTGADLSRANLTGARLVRAWLAEANLTGANLTGAYLDFALLDGARLFHTDLRGAWLNNTDLAAAEFLDPDLTGAIWSPDKVAPDGWQLDALLRLKRSEPSSGDAAAE
jgi:hypothetical protein